MRSHVVERRRYDPTITEFCLGTGWGNCEFRTFTFNASTGGKASITETDQSKRLRSGTEKPLTGAEELNLEETSKVALNTSDYGKLNPS